ncbi:helix-turn-helix domain-containing protein [Streptomyces sp. B3I8]|uniref:helix-turn-helix domain-containing protein n=1 Tax=Streptomyces sp. B3I8 TaxID=3042303 RepID=UPI002781EE82|nr:XRE family transcriptional regulator [Streptomyces sp. B3I8]MDQ0790812.1 transcriptional regulator with XRE-family HTH domain [Streptomyces sp. B3I8]
MDPGVLKAVLQAVGPRLRALRRQGRATLDDISERSGISSSTLSRLESGQRKFTLDLLLPLAVVHGLPLDELVGAPPTGDPRLHLRPVAVPGQGQTVLPLVRHSGGPHVHKHVLPVRATTATRQSLHAHAGYSWVYVMRGRLSITAGSRRVVLVAGEATEFDTRLPHSLSNADEQPVEFLSVFGAQGERMRIVTSWVECSE